MSNTIIIIENMMILDAQLKRSLQKNGYVVEKFPHGESCLERLDEDVLPDVMLMDSKLGGGRINLTAVAKRIYEKYNIQIIPPSIAQEI